MCPAEIRIDGIIGNTRGENILIRQTARELGLTKDTLCTSEGVTAAGIAAIETYAGTKVDLIQRFLLFCVNELQYDSESAEPTDEVEVTVPVPEGFRHNGNYTEVSEDELQSMSIDQEIPTIIHPDDLEELQVGDCTDFTVYVGKKLREDNPDDQILFVFGGVKKGVDKYATHAWLLWNGKIVECEDPQGIVAFSTDSEKAQPYVEVASVSIDYVLGRIDQFKQNQQEIATLKTENEEAAQQLEEKTQELKEIKEGMDALEQQLELLRRLQQEGSEPHGHTG